VGLVKIIVHGKSVASMADSLHKKKGNRPDGEDLPAARNESVTVSDIEKLFSLMRENEIAELEIEQYKTKIHIVSKAAPVAAQPIMQYMPAGMQAYPMMQMGSQQAAGSEAPANTGGNNPEPSAGATHKPAGGDAEESGSSLPPNAKTILSPMVGTFYRSPSPEAPMFVKEGDVVNEETVLCIIEATKLMNEIKAEARGKIVRILVENGMPVEFNQPLFVLEP
jgi:acetyl-CoA carboxylase biotin carboxyl carrier protein